MKKIISLVFAFTMVFVLAATAMAAPAPKDGVDLKGNAMTWSAADNAAVASHFTGSTQKDKSVPSTALIPVPSARSNASGDKITSNAHSGDYPGLYFYWNDKQKDDGFLKVDPAIFTWFEEDWFIVTAKNSNAYWDYKIVLNEGYVTSEGYLLYQIPRYFMYTEANNKNGKVTEVKDELKNINMIFIDGLWRTFDLTIIKNWETKNEASAVATLTNGYSFGSKTTRLYAFDSYPVNFKENNIANKDYNGYKYEFSFVKVSVNDVESDENLVSFDAVAGGKYVVVFTNNWTKTPLPSTYIVNKAWFADFAIPDGLKAELSFDGFDVGNINQQISVVEGDKIQITENPIVYEDADYVYEVTLTSITVNGVTVAAVDITVVRNSSYRVVFTNTVTRTEKPKTAPVVVNKEWTGLQRLAGVEATFGNPVTNFDFELGVSQDVLVGTSIVVKENAIASYKFGNNIYTITLTEIWVDGVLVYDYLVDNADDAVAELTVAAGNGHVILFVNDVNKIETPATLYIDKTWNFVDIPQEIQAEIIALLSFTNGYGLSASGIGFIIEDTPLISFSENAIVYTGTDGYVYTIRLTGVTLNGARHTGNSVNQVYFVPDVDTTEYFVIFTNEVTRVKSIVPPIILNEKLPSKQHWDLWWDDYGILCYAASSNNDDDYFFGLDKARFFEVYESATIGFGTKDNIQFTITLTEDMDLFEWLTIDMYGDAHHAGNGAKNYHYGEVWYSDYVNNFFGAGAMQAWLLEVQPK